MTQHSFKMLCVITCAVASLFSIAPASAGNDDGRNRSSVTNAVRASADWSIRLPKDEQVVYRGVVNFDSAGMSAGTMMYPALNAGGFLAAVITHGLLIESMKDSQKQKLQEAADKVLEPYRDVINGYQYKHLMQRGLEKLAISGNKRLVEFSEKPGASWFIESTPAFSLTQDQSALILDNAISIYAPNTPDTPVFQSFIRIVSHVKTGEDLAAAWTANNGEKLKEESVNLFAESLQISVDEISAKTAENNSLHKTFRYWEGGVEKMERAQLVSERCNRVVLRTLRGWLMSVPYRKADSGASTDACIQNPSAATAN